VGPSLGENYRERPVPFQVPVKIIGSISDVEEGGVDLRSLHASIACERLGAKVVLHYTAVFAEPGTTALVYQNITITHSVRGNTRVG
jgi:hypothetical protein